jgi:hypothetical protein
LRSASQRTSFFIKKADIHVVVCFAEDFVPADIRVAVCFAEDFVFYKIKKADIHTRVADICFAEEKRMSSALNYVVREAGAFTDVIRRDTAPRCGGQSPGDSTWIHPSAKRRSGPPGLCPGEGLRPGGEVQAFDYVIRFFYKKRPRRDFDFDPSIRVHVRVHVRKAVWCGAVWCGAAE